MPRPIRHVTGAARWTQIAIIRPTARKTWSGEQSPEDTRTNFAAIRMLVSGRVGGRALPLDAAPEATRGTSGECIGSIGGPRDSVGDRRDGSGVYP